MCLCLAVLWLRFIGSGACRGSLRSVRQKFTSLPARQWDLKTHHQVDPVPKRTLSDGRGWIQSAHDGKTWIQSAHAGDSIQREVCLGWFTTSAHCGRHKSSGYVPGFHRSSFWAVMSDRGSVKDLSDPFPSCWCTLSCSGSVPSSACTRVTFARVFMSSLYPVPRMDFPRDGRSF